MTKLEFIKMWSVKARRAYWQWRAASATNAVRDALETVKAP